MQWIGNGIDLVRFQPDEQVRQRFRRSIGVFDDRIVFGIVGRLVPVKSHATLIEAFGIVHRHHPAARLVVAGDGPEMAALTRQVARAGLADAVVFLGEVRHTQDVFNGLDVYMLASLTEGMNLTLLEAMATALPVIATAVGGNAEVVVNGRSGMLVPALQPHTMAERMLELAASASLRDRLGAHGRHVVQQRFSQAATMLAYMELYSAAPP